MNLKKMMQGLVFFLTSLLVFVFLFRALLPTASPRMTKPKTAAKEITYTYVALGDSLTEGVGDSTKQGGFVPILAQSLSNENDGQYQPVNYGVAGNTSAQLTATRFLPQMSVNIISSPYLLVMSLLYLVAQRLFATLPISNVQRLT